MVFLVLGSFLALKVFKLSLTTAVGISVFGATVGAFVSYIYLVAKKNKNRKKFDDKVRTVNEPIITNKQIIKKIILYALPFIMIDVFKSLYNYVDMVTVVKGLVKYANYTVKDAEIIMSMLSTWGGKFNMILLSISTGIIVSLIPNLTSSLVKQDIIDIRAKINQSLSMLLFLTIPMAFGLSFLAKPVWTLFYGVSEFGPNLLSYFIFVGLFMGLFTSIISVVQVLKDYKCVFYSLLVGLLLKVVLNTNLMVAFYKMGISAYYGVITASIIGYLASFIICLVVLNLKYKVNYEALVKNLMDILCGSVLMILVLFVIKFFIPIYSNSRIFNLFIILIYSLVGSLVYLLFAYKIGILKNVFGNKINKLFNKKRK